MPSCIESRRRLLKYKIDLYHIQTLSCVDKDKDSFSSIYCFAIKINITFPFLFPGTIRVFVEANSDCFIVNYSLFYIVSLHIDIYCMILHKIGTFKKHFRPCVLCIIAVGSDNCVSAIQSIAGLSQQYSLAYEQKLKKNKWKK